MSLPSGFWWRIFLGCCMWAIVYAAAFVLLFGQRLGWF